MEKLKGLDLEGKKVLDAGTGACGMTKHLEDRGAEIISVDINTEYLKQCKEQTETAQFLRADLSDLTSLKSETFDYVVCNFVISALSENKDIIITSVLREFEKVLKENGTLVIIDYYPFEEAKSPAPLDRSHIELWRLENAISELIGEGHLEEYTPEVLEEELNSIGFQNMGTSTLLEPVPWPIDLLREHEIVIKDNIDKLESDRLKESLMCELEKIMDSTEDRKVESGAIYELRAEK